MAELNSVLAGNNVETALLSSASISALQVVRGNAAADGLEGVSPGTGFLMDFVPEGPPDTATQVAGAITLNFLNKIHLKSTLSQAITTITLENIADGTTVEWVVTQTTGFAITFPGSAILNIAGLSGLTFPACANTTLIFSIFNHANGTYIVSVRGAPITAAFLPGSDAAIDLGSTAAAWRHLFLTGSLELGHDSDTTLARSAAGVLAVEGVPLFPNLPINSLSAAKTFTVAEMNQTWYHPSSDANARTWTIDSNSNAPAPLGNFIQFINRSANAVTIAITSDTLVWSPAGTTGSRTLAQYGVATAVKTTTTEWFISGSGLT